MTNLQTILTITGLLVQIALVATALWYTIETRHLRKQSSAQLALINRQHILAVAPFLMPSISAKKEMIQRAKSESESEQKNEKLSFLNSLPSETFLCTVENQTSRIALHVEGIMYTADSKHFLSGEVGIACLGEKADYDIWFGENPAMTQVEAIDLAKGSYPQSTNINNALLDHEDEHYVVIFYKDIEESVYCVKRPFYIDDDGDAILRRPEFLKLS